MKRHCPSGDTQVQAAEKHVQAAEKDIQEDCPQNIVTSSNKLNCADEMISPQRRISLRSWKGKPQVDIREYYSDSLGETKPGRKGIGISSMLGISLSLDQFNALAKAIPRIQAMITCDK
ncbi:hypothetical protein MDAP_001968 [Mitosporidium daphniae]|uniref:Putative RNA polymerase II transcriptional protein n=1 Tax=Mitosporidium daphniae TaxID=1485682 RepID=A0A098VN61_9MICR|nr:putative RNA polymerase II transcriptional protein [Mitosporidium daphniae]KGG50488.1 putative RNA polymerase II transcriptional protein [Mitosporidium daphniae]|eukprot:XP_013236915.1 putative RNA polymerase II transcriptional protein [Mitosporidium daphniae]